MTLKCNQKVVSWGVNVPLPDTYTFGRTKRETLSYHKKTLAYLVDKVFIDTNVHV